MLKKISRYVCYVFFAFIFFTVVPDFVNKGMYYVNEFINVKGDHVQLTENYPLADLAGRIKANVPPHACITTSLNKDESIIKTVAFKYFLFPLKIKDNSENEYNHRSIHCDHNYFIDLRHGETAQLMKWSKVMHPPTKNVWIWYVLFNMIILLIGYCLLRGLFLKTSFFGLFSLFSSSYLLGFIMATLFFWLLTLIEIQLSFNTVCGLLFILLFISYFFMRIRGTSLFEGYTKSPKMPLDTIYDICGAGILFFCALTTFSIPIIVVDELNIWLLKAKMFYAHQGLIFDYTDYHNNYYPVLWPLFISLQYIFIGGDLDQVAKWTSATIFLCLIGQMFWMCKLLRFNHRFSWITIFIFIFCFNHWTFFTALGETTYMALMLLSVSFLIHWQTTNNKKSFIIMLIALSGLSIAKFESIFFILFFIGAYFLSNLPLFADMRNKIKNTLFMLISLTPLGLWVIWLKVKHIPYEVYYLKGPVLMDNIKSLFDMSLEILSNATTIYIICAGILSLFIFRSKKAWSREEIFLLMLSLCLVFSALFAGLCWPNSDFRLYYPEVLTRLFSRLMPFVVILLMCRIKPLSQNTP